MLFFSSSLRCLFNSSFMDVINVGKSCTESIALIASVSPGRDLCTVAIGGAVSVRLAPRLLVSYQKELAVVADRADCKTFVCQRTQPVLAVTLLALVAFLPCLLFLKLLCECWSPRTLSSERKDVGTLKCPFHQSCLEALGADSLPLLPGSSQSDW